ncbi:hypothetical protein ACHMW6_25135 [Pseudoduganella sp. UC29_106]|uniref:hypothetical protein n=1 Tax=Pseudoduganella sp. UC29_106 TaxID=3374553 RepID=UPI003757038C
MMLALANIDSDKNVHRLVLFNRVHATSRHSKFDGQRLMAAGLGIHVTDGFGRYPGQVPISDHQPSTKPGDNTPRIMGDWGQESCPTWLANTPSIEVCL